VDEPPRPELPQALAAPKSRRALPLVWLVPAVAIAVGTWLALSDYLERGTTVVISFRTAEGLQAGKTKIKSKDIDVGSITKITLAPDLSGVIATAEMVKGTESRLVEDTRFWVVRPRIGTAGVSGLGTLLSGAYIGVDAGASEQARDHFVGLDQPPLVLRGEPGRSFVLQGIRRSRRPSRTGRSRCDRARRCRLLRGRAGAHRGRRRSMHRARGGDRREHGGDRRRGGREQGAAPLPLS